MQELRYNTDNQIVCLGPLLANSDGDTEQNSLTIANTDILIYKDGATSLVAKNSGGATLMSDGKYYCTLDSTDTNTRGYFEINIHMTGALYLVFKGQVVNQNYWDAKYGDDYLQVDTVEVSGTSQTANDNGADINTILTAQTTIINHLTSIKDNNAGADFDPATDSLKVLRENIFDPSADTVIVGTNNDKEGYALSDSGVDAILDESIDGAYTMRRLIRLISAALFGQLSGAKTTTVVIRDINNTKVRITATVDEKGNRSSLVLDGD